MRKLILALPLFVLPLVGLVGCPNPQPVPPTPDADAAPSPPTPSADSAPNPVVVDASPPADPCTQACATMNAVGCAQQPDCAKVLSLTQNNRISRNPKTGNALNCNDLVGVKSPADVTANGWNCGSAAKH